MDADRVGTLHVFKHQNYAFEWQGDTHTHVTAGVRAHSGIIGSNRFFTHRVRADRYKTSVKHAHFPLLGGLTYSHSSTSSSVRHNCHFYSVCVCMFNAYTVWIINDTTSLAQQSMIPHPSAPSLLGPSRQTTIQWVGPIFRGLKPHSSHLLWESKHHYSRGSHSAPLMKYVETWTIL